MALTLEQVAKLAGVSRSTVSRIINEHPSVRPEVRQRVWDDLSVTGFDDVPVARLMNPPLTTVQPPVAELARLAADNLVQLLENPGVPIRPHLLSAHMIVRGSTRPL